MCLMPSPPKQQIVDPSDRAAAAAADAVAQRRRTAQGYTASLLGGVAGLDGGDQPSVARQTLGLG